LVQTQKRSPSRVSPNHLDYAEIQKAISRIEEITQDINRAIKEAESRDYCIQIQQKIDTKFGTVSLPIPCLVEAHRKFIKEGTVSKYASLLERNNKRLFLFNDILLICTNAFGTFLSTKYTVEHTFFLENTTVNSPPSPDTFEVTDETAHFVFLVDSPEIKKEWLTVLVQTLTQHKIQFEENRLRGISVVSREMMAKEQAYSEATKCFLCQKDFRFFYSPRREHSCRGCGNAVCSECSLNRRGDETRLCDTCWHTNTDLLTPY